MRYVFENATELASVPATSSGQEPPIEGLSQGADATFEASDKLSLQTEAAAQGILTALYSVSEDQGNEVASICRYS